MRAIYARSDLAIQRYLSYSAVIPVAVSSASRGDHACDEQQDDDEDGGTKIKGANQNRFGIHHESGKGDQNSDG